MYCGSLLQNRATAGERLKEDLARIVAKKPDCKSIVLSAENLSNPSGFPTIFEEISEIYDIRIIFYIRRQDDYLISAWQQWYCKIYSDFNSWAKADWFRANWELVCRDWEKVVPLDHMRVRTYESASRADGGILADFASAIGYPEPKALSQPTGVENQSLSDSVTDLATGKKSLFRDIHDNDFYKMILDLTGNKYVKRKGETALPIEDRYQIIASYRQCNEWLCKTFGLAENADRLFPDIRQQNLHELTTEEISREKEEIILSLILGNYSQQKALAKKI
jgi:hypothetical protein